MSNAFHWFLTISSFLLLLFIYRILRVLLCNLLLTGTILNSSLKLLDKNLGITLKVSDMSNIKLDEVVCHDSEESELSSWKGKVASDEKVNRVYDILTTIHKEGKRSLSSSTANVENGTRSDRLFKGNEKHARVVGRSGPLISGTAYCISSCSMILLNKVVLSSYNFKAGISLMFYQNLIACLVIAILGLCGAISVEKHSWRLIRVWIPIISAVSGGITDLSFDATGLDFGNYGLKSGSLNRVSMVFLNNFLSLPFAIFLIFVLNEWEYVMNTFGLFSNVIRLPMFWVFATASGLLGLAISFTSMWFLHQTGPTTYSLVGSLNKVPISIAGLALFKVPFSVPNLFSILFVRKWFPEFHPSSTTIDSKVVWVDSNTSFTSKGRFARVYVEIEFGHPLVPKIEVDDVWTALRLLLLRLLVRRKKVEHSGGGGEDGKNTTGVTEVGEPPVESAKSSSADFGPWMIAQRPKSRKNSRNLRGDAWKVRNHGRDKGW
ncbi:GDP-mannose transporter GONST2 [Hibiscus syriacus]|uniref:GDP-mannose transporter GONST2 n=1 Tax=Hibiscus syriacus TaxID=106335 RepID=A0A6A3ALZ4_HIBSY|nr:GDP-mannose transporter GONST2 [Hibiscus syriacus]